MPEGRAQAARQNLRLALRATLPELVLLLLVLASFVSLVRTFLVTGYLPQPYIWDPQDTFMDWFNTAYWANHWGAYSVWRSIYPPLSFFVLRVFSISSCYATSPFAARDCDWLSITAILTSYVAAIAVSYLALRRNDPRTAVMRTLAIAFGYRSLYALERGQLLIMCYIGMVVAFGFFAASRPVRAIAAGLMINFKPYMLVVTLAWGIRREWRQLELAAIATVLIYLATWAAVGGGSLAELIANTINWITFTGGDVVGEIYYSTSFNGLFGVIDRGAFPVLRYFRSDTYDTFRFVMKTVMAAAQLTGIVALLLAWLQPRAVPLTRLACIALLISLTNRSPGGYTEMFLMFLVFMEPWRGFARITAITIIYLNALNIDWQLSTLPAVHMIAWLSGKAVTGQFGIAIGQFTHPLGLLVVLMLLSLETIREVTLAYRTQRPQLSLAARPQGTAT
ncbi:MAG: glycosyltransferase 87 family protein [Novosphingobium sp.]